MDLQLPQPGARVAGRVVEGGTLFETRDPADGTVVCELRSTPSPVLGNAVLSARAAFEQRGEGREGCPYARELYTQVKNVYVDLS